MSASAGIGVVGATTPHLGVLHSNNPLKLPKIPNLFPPHSPSTISRHSSSLISKLPSLSPTAFPSYDEDEDEDEDEQVIGDCLVFEDGIFDDPFLQEQQQNPCSSSSTSPEKLVPEEWNQAVVEINLTKKERRKLAQETQFGHRILNKKKANSVNLGEYLRFQNYKLSQLKPTLLDNPPGIPLPLKHDDNQNQTSSSSSSRVEPKNPRWAVYGRGLDDITQFFNSASYQPADDDKSQGRQKLFTKEEKVLMNARIPKLATATSLKWLPLHTLTASGEFYLVNTLLKYEVDINAADQDGLTALHKAIICKKQAITNHLLSESANSSVRDKDGATLMHYAVQTASSQAIKTLVLHNVDINLQDNDGWTPLHLAVQARRTDVVRLLLVKGADKTLRNQDGLTPLELCLYSGRDSKTYELIKLLKQLPRKRR